jgi:hypothetical protein
MCIEEGVYIGLAGHRAQLAGASEAYISFGYDPFARNIRQFVGPMLPIVSNDDYIGKHAKFPVAHDSSDGAPTISVMHNYGDDSPRWCLGFSAILQQSYRPQEYLFSV